MGGSKVSTMAQQLTYDLVLKIDAALKEVKALAKTMESELDSSSKSAGNKAGQNIAKNLREKIASAKIDLLKGASFDEAKIRRLGTTINNTLKTGSITSPQALSLFRSLPQQASSAGKQSGNNFGASFKGIATSIIGAMSFGVLVNKIMGAFNASVAYSKSVTNLEGAVSAYNKKQQNTNSILNDSTKSIEQKALALGYDTGKIYENTKATQSNESAIKKLDAEITNAQRAFEDSSRVLETNITITEKSEKAIEKQIKIANREKDVIDEKVKALEKETEQRVKNIQIQRGFDTLDTEVKALEIQKNQFEIERDTAQLRGDKIAFEQAKENIEKLDLEISLRENKLDAIEFETDAIRRQGDLQKQVLEEQKNGIEKQISLLNDQKDIVIDNITNIREELSAKKNQFDIDIEPAKRKLEDLRATNISVGGGQVLKKSVIDDINKQMKNVPKAISSKPFLDLQEKLFRDFQGTVSRGEISQSISDLILSGVDDVGDAEQIIKRFGDIAANGKSNYVSMGQAVSSLAEQFRSERAALGETAGLNEEYISQIIPRGLALLQSQGELQGKSVENLTDEEKALVKKAGLMDVTAGRQGAFNKQLNSGNLAADQLKGQLSELELTVGEALAPTIRDLIKFIIPAINKTKDWAKENPSLVNTLTQLSLIIVTLGTILLTFGGIVAGVMAGVILAIGLVKTAWDNDFGGIITKITEFIDFFKKEIMPNIIPIIDELKTLFSGLWNFIRPFVEEMVRGFTGQIDNIKVAFKGIVEVVRGVLEVINGLFSGDGDKIKQGLENITNGLVNILKGFANSFIDIINNGIIGKIRDFTRSVRGRDFFGFKVPWIDDISNIPRFAKGGDFMVPQGYPNDSYLMRVQSGERVIVQTPSQQNISTNSGNTINYNNYGNGMVPRGNSLSFIQGFI